MEKGSGRGDDSGEKIFLENITNKFLLYLIRDDQITNL
jgi:hypothetical protein